VEPRSLPANLSLSALFDTFEEIRETSSRLEKEALLRDLLRSKNAEIFHDIVKWVYDPYRRTRIKVSGAMADRALSLDNEQFESDQEEWSRFLFLLNAFEIGDVSGKAAREKVVEFLSRVYLEHVEWYVLLFNKKLKIGVGRETIESLLPGEVPRFRVKLCTKYSADHLRGTYLVQPKYDGIRGVCGRFLSLEMVALSRNGRPLFNAEPILEDLETLEDFYDRAMVFDGEFFAGNWETTLSNLKTRSAHKVVDTRDLKFFVFDAVPLDLWETGSLLEHPCWRRCRELEEAVNTLASPRVIRVPSEIVSSHEDVLALTHKYVAEGYEGSVLKHAESSYDYDRNAFWMKFKFVQEVDARIVGVKLGLHDPSTNEIVDEDDPRAGSLQQRGAIPVVRALVVDHGRGTSTSVGSGLTIQDRYALYQRFAEGRLDGLTVEVHYQSETSDGKLLFPRYRRLREDK
jgi:ATP-dependent DNA ligase